MNIIQNSNLLFRNQLLTFVLLGEVGMNGIDGLPGEIQVQFKAISSFSPLFIR